MNYPTCPARVWAATYGETAAPQHDRAASRRGLRLVHRLDGGCRADPAPENGGEA